MTAPTITELPDPPSRGNAPEVFIARADAFLGALPAFGAQANALAVYFDDQVAAVEDIVSSAGYSGTSTSAIVIGTGSKSFFTQANLSFVPGVYVSLADSAAPTVNSMVGTVTAYNRTSGAMTVNVSVIKGAGEKSSWSLSLSGPPGSDAAVTGPAVISALGYTPVNKAGDVVSGSLIVGSAYTGEAIIQPGEPGRGGYIEYRVGGVRAGYVGYADASSNYLSSENGRGWRVLGANFLINGVAPYTSANDGSGSGLDADLLRGLVPHHDPVATTIVSRTADGSIATTLINISGEREFKGIYWSTSGAFLREDGAQLSLNAPLYLESGVSASTVTERSDRNLKSDIVDLEPVLGRLRPVRYRLKETGEERIGFIAQEIQALNPLAACKPEDGSMEVRLMGVIAILSAQVNALEDRLYRLEGGT